MTGVPRSVLPACPRARGRERNPPVRAALRRAPQAVHVRESVPGDRP